MTSHRDYKVDQISVINGTNLDDSPAMITAVIERIFDNATRFISAAGSHLIEKYPNNPHQYASRHAVIDLCWENIADVEVSSAYFKDKFRGHKDLPPAVLEILQESSSSIFDLMAEARESSSGISFALRNFVACREAKNYKTEFDFWHNDTFSEYEFIFRGVMQRRDVFNECDRPCPWEITFTDKSLDIVHQSLTYRFAY
jgi:hypothetical protein